MLRLGLELNTAQKIPSLNSRSLFQVCLVQPSSEKLPPAPDKNIYRDPQPDNMKKVRDLGTLSSKLDISIKCLYSGMSREEVERV